MKRQDASACWALAAMFEQLAEDDARRGRRQAAAAYRAAAEAARQMAEELEKYHPKRAGLYRNKVL